MDQVRTGTCRGAAAAAGVVLAVTGLGGCAAGDPASRPWTRQEVNAYATDRPTGSPVRELTAEQALEEAVDNTASSAVRIHGDVTDPQGIAYRLDMRFGRGGGSGTVTAGQSTARLLRVGDDVWIKAPYAFWAAIGGSNFAAAYRDKYVPAPAGDPAFAGLVAHTYPDRLIARFTDGARRPAKGGKEEKVDGRPGVPLRLKGESGYDGTVWVSADGAPQILRITTAEDSPVTGTIHFTDHGERHEPAPPRPEQVAD